MNKFFRLWVLSSWLFVGVCNADLPDSQIIFSLGGATASSSLGNNLPSYAIDASNLTYWSSGKSASAKPWIQFDMGQSRAVSKLRLRPAQSPSGTTTHKIYVGDVPSNLQLANSITGYTVGGVPFDVPVMAKGRYIRIVTTQSPSWVAWEQVDAFETKGGVKYFGYYLGGYYNSLTAGHSNLSFFYGDGSFPTRINDAISHNMKAVVSVDQIFFSGKSLRPDYLARWNSLKSLMVGYESQIAAFYVIDEPARIGASQSDIQAVITTLKSTFPNTPTAAIFDYNHMNGLVSLFDWVGVDLYDDGSGATFLAVKAMRSRLDLSRQRLILVPQAGMPRATFDGEYSNEAQNGLQDETLVFQDLALNDPLVIAVIPFIWQTYVEGDNNWYGLEDIPSLQAWFQSFGYSVVSQSNQTYGGN